MGTERAPIRQRLLPKPRLMPRWLWPPIEERLWALGWRSKHDVEVARMDARNRRWIAFTDRELRSVYLALAQSPSGGSHRDHDMMTEIIVEANRRGEGRAKGILG
jgi:hypothetical protein